MSRGRAGAYQRIQGPHNNKKDRAEYQQLEDLILADGRVECKVVVHTDKILIHTETLADFYLARSIIRNRVTKEIIRAI